MTATSVPPIDPDPSLRGVRELFCSEGVDLVAGFLSERGFEPQSLRPVQALYRPTSSCLVRYRVLSRDPDGRDRHLTVCAEIRAEPKEPRPPASSFAERHRFPDPVEKIGPYLMWVFPYDPGLPAMSDAAWGPWVKTELSRSGRSFRGVDVHPVMYRPRRRAMFRYLGLGGAVAGDTSVTYGKVLRSTRLARSLEVTGALQPRRGLIQRLLGRGPSLRFVLPFGQAGRNTLLFAPARGRSLRDLLLNDETLPHPSRVIDIMHEIARLDPRDMGPSARHAHPPGELARTTAVLVSCLLPDEADSVTRLCDVIESGAEEEKGERLPVHGDLYDGQIFIDEDFSLSLIDLDDAGIGDPAQDAANFSAHLVVMALSNPEARQRLLAYRTLLQQLFMERFDVSPDVLAWREALVVMQLSVGPFRILDPAWPAEVRKRLELAVRILHYRGTSTS